MDAQPVKEMPKGPVHIAIGDIFEIKGIRFRVSYVNVGKQRLTLEPCMGAPGEMAPPVDNEHVAPGGEPFSDAVIEANRPDAAPADGV